MRILTRFLEPVFRTFVSHRNNAKFPNTPPIPLQQESAECGLISVSAFSTLYGIKVSQSSLRQEVRSTSRGLTIRNVRDLTRRIGFGAEVVG
jgi:ABC-type bacteriocin/lantibiotic exporter with double-glycine peptidase domain